MSLTPEARQRINKAKDALRALQDKLPADPKVADWLRNNEGTSDALFAIERLEQVLEAGASDAESTLSTLREIVGETDDSELIAEVRSMSESRNGVPAPSDDEEPHLDLTEETVEVDPRENQDPRNWGTDRSEVAGISSADDYEDDDLDEDDEVEYA